MTPRMRSFVLLVAILLLSWAVLGSFIGCSNEKQQITPPVVGPAAGSGPMGGGDTQRLQLTASPSETLTTVGSEQGRITVTALVENSIGQAMPNGTAIYWSTTQGTISPTTGTSSNGSSEATITFPKSFNGCTTVTARSGDVSATIWLCVSNLEATPTPSKAFIVQAGATTVSNPGTTSITATAKTNGKPDSGIQVDFAVSGTSAILSASAAETDAAGAASVTLTNTNSSGTQQTVTVTASTSDGRSGSVQLLIQ